jgi:hypothetical protein
MALIGYKVVTSSGFNSEILNVNFLPSNFLQKAHLMVTLRGGILGERLKLTKDEIKEIEVLHEEETSSDTGQRIKNGAIGVVLLGPIGLLGAALGGAKSLITIRVLTHDNRQLILEMKPKECEKIFKDLVGINLQEEINKGLLK